ncbi:RNAse P Rpr2/Rpp21/SNM1 subunit domain-containing protein [Aspergillus falconensis]
MAKTKGKKGSGGGVNSHVRARIDYLYNAAAYLQSAKAGGALKDVANREDEVMSDAHTAPPSAKKPRSDCRGECAPRVSRLCISQMRGVSQKSQLRLPIEQKRSFCKRCDTLLIPGTNCIEETRNPSRGASKPWAEVRVVRCNICRTEKRFPQTNKRSRKIIERKRDGKAENVADLAKTT